MTEFDVITKPRHYNSHPSGVEAIDLLAGMEHRLACTVKYLYRLDHKGKRGEDLGKSGQYLTWVRDNPEPDTSAARRKFIRFVEGDPRATDEDRLIRDLLVADELSPEVRRVVAGEILRRIEALPRTADDA